MASHPRLAAVPDRDELAVRATVKATAAIIRHATELFAVEKPPAASGVGVCSSVVYVVAREVFERIKFDRVSVVDGAPVGYLRVPNGIAVVAEDES